MDHGARLASPRPMMTNIIYAIMFMLTMAVQTGAIASLPEPLRFFPLALVIGVIVLHERSLSLGAAWIVIAGVILEARGLSDGAAIASLVAAVVAVVLAVLVFAKRSFWALLGVGGGTAIAYVVARLGWLTLGLVFTRQSLHLGQIAEQSVTIVLMALLGMVVFGAYIRRFLRWSRDKFVSKGQLYDVSFPQ